jgi:hypothetical protein
MLWPDLLALAVLATRPASDAASGTLTKDEQRHWGQAVRLPHEWQGTVMADDAYQGWCASIRRLHRRVADLFTDTLQDGKWCVPLTDVVMEGRVHEELRLRFPLDQLTVGKGWNDVQAGIEPALLLRLGQGLARYGGLFETVSCV